MFSDVLLWQWSLITQLVSGVMIAGFLAAFRRSFATRAMRQWTIAWFANFAALLVAFCDVYIIDSSDGIGTALIVGVQSIAMVSLLAQAMVGIGFTGGMLITLRRAIAPKTTIQVKTFAPIGAGRPTDTFYATGLRPTTRSWKSRQGTCDADASTAA